MWGFPWMFWLVAFLVWMLAARRRRWRRYALRAGAYPPAAPWPWAPWWEGRYDARSRGGTTPAGAWRELEEQRGYVEALETRVAQLEERLDFTERLLAGRRSVTPSSEG